MNGGDGRRSAGKAVPRAVPQGTIPRQRLTELLDEGARRRLVTITADAGFGKSTLLASWADDRPCAWYTLTAADRPLAAMVAGLVDALRLRVPALSPAVAAARDPHRGPDADAEQPMRALAYAELLADVLQRELTDDLVLILDDLHEITADDPAAKLVEGLVRVAPPRLHIVCASRTQVPFGIDRLRGRGQVLELEAQALVFTPDETSEVLRAVLGDDGAEEVAATIHTAVQGWPAAVRLAGEALRTVGPGERKARLRRALRPGAPVYDYLAEEVFAGEPANVRRFLSVAAILPKVDADLCEHLGLDRAIDVLDGLDARGLFLSGSETEGYQLNPLVRDFALTRMPLPAEEREAITERAGRWYADAGEHRDALSCLTELHDAAPVAALLRESGHVMIARGAAEAVIGAVGKVPDALRDADIDQLEGEARQMLGDWQGAQLCFSRVIPPTGPIPVGLARRAGLIYHLRGHLDEAMDTYSRGALDGSDDREEALLQAWWAAAHWLRGDVEECRKRAAIAFAKARSVGDDRALAAAHTVLGMLAGFDSDPRAHAAHYLHALDHAERAGDVLQSIRIRVNRGSHHTSEANYARAIAELDVAIRLADLAGFGAFRALALSNRGEALLGLGRLDEAIKELEASRALYQRLESRLVAQPLTILGEVYRERGDLAMARACYEESISIGNDIGDVQSLVPALAGLARVLVEEEPERAAELADLARRAVSYGPVLGHSVALLSLGWVTLQQGDQAAATETADEAAAVCRRRRDRAGLAAALELKAAAVGHSGAVVGDPSEQLLLEALSIRREIGDPLGEARLELMLASQAAGSASARELAESAHQRFLACGATRHAATAQLIAERSGPPAVEVECLGGFRVLRDGRAVALSEWPSRKARDLLKILVARRSHPVPRSQLLDLLWPGEDEGTVSPRLSVALSTVRSVLDPDKRYPADRFVGGDRSTVWLDDSVLAVDVEAFLRDAQAGLEALAAGRVAQSVLLLRAAEAAYAGDFLEEDVYQDWAMGLRDEARALYIRVARALADRSANVGEHDAAAGYLLRILQRDAYDERAHLALVSSYVASGAHGEARRAYRTYASRLGELGVEPAPFPGVATRAGAAG